MSSVETITSKKMITKSKLQERFRFLKIEGIILVIITSIVFTFMCWEDLDLQEHLEFKHYALLLGISAYIYIAYFLSTIRNLWRIRKAESTDKNDLYDNSSNTNEGYHIYESEEAIQKRKLRHILIHIRNEVLYFMAFFAIPVTLTFSAWYAPAPGHPIKSNVLLDSNHVSWKYSKSSHTLTIYGTGEIKDFYLDKAPWFVFSKEIESVRFSGDITYIGDYSFADLKNLKDIKWPDCLEAVGMSAFQNTGFVEIILPDTLDEIPTTMFYGCKDLKSVHLPEGIKVIGNNAFKDCENLSDINIPKSVEKVEPTFSGCSKLYDEDGFFIRDHILYGCISKEKEIVVPDSVRIINGGAFKDTEADSIIVPDSVEKLSDEAFSECKMKKITIGDGIKQIPTFCFYKCHNLREVNLPDSVVEITNQAFAYCSSLQEVHLGKNIKEVHPSSFDGCFKLVNVYIGDSEVNNFENGFLIKDHILYSCFSKEKEIVVPDSVRIINGGAFRNIEADSIIVPDSVEKLSDEAFSECKMKKITIGDGINGIPSYCFYKCYNLQEVNLPESLKKIGSAAFAECPWLVKIIIPQNVKKIGPGVFLKCYLLNRIDLPDSVTEIPGQAFAYCVNLREVYMGENTKIIHPNSFEGCVKLEKAYIGDSKLDIN